MAGFTHPTPAGGSEVRSFRFLLFIGASALAVYFVAAIFLKSISSELNISLRTDAARVLVLRAIQIERFGRTAAVSTNSANGFKTVPNEVHANPMSISCQDEVDIVSEDEIDSLPILTLLPDDPNWWFRPYDLKWKAVVVYQGSCMVPQSSGTVLRRISPALPAIPSR